MKKLIALLVVLCMVFAIAACQKKVVEPPVVEQPPVVDAQPPVVDEQPPVIDDEPAGLIKVGIVNLEPSESGYREANVKDMAEVFTAENGYDALFSNVPTLDAQINDARSFITEGVKYLLISAADANGWDAVLGEAQAAGVTVFLFDRMINADPSLYAAAVVSDMANQGTTAVAWLKAQELEVYNVIHIQGQVTSDASKGRTAALQAEFDAGTMNMVRRGTGGDTWSDVEAKKIVEAAIAAKESFNVIYAENDGMAEGAMKALEENGITFGVGGDVIIMGFDCNKFALRYVMEGKWNYDGQCSPFQANVIDGFIKALEAGGTIDVPADKKVISEELGFDAEGKGAIKVDQAVIDKYGLGD